MIAGQHRIHEGLHAALFEHFQDYAGVLGIVLVPGIEHGFAILGLRDRRNPRNFHTGLQEAMSDWPVIISGRFQRSMASAAESVQEFNQTIKILGTVGHFKAMPLSAGRLDQYGIPVAGHIDCNPMTVGLNMCSVSHLGSLLRT